MKVISDIESSILSRCVGAELIGRIEEYEFDTATQLVERGLLHMDEIIVPCEDDDDSEYVDKVYTTNTMGCLALTCWRALKNGAIEL